MTNEFKPDYVSPPGDTIREIMRDNEITPTDIMEHCGIELAEFCRLILGGLKITDDIAEGLENASNVPAKFWLKRQFNYDEFKKTEPVTIDAMTYKTLREESEWLGYLQSAGLDNWDGISYAHELQEADE